MGGTSADIALVRDGQPVYSTDETVGDFPIVMPVVGVSSIGAGGGSIAWLDSRRRAEGRPAERGRRPRACRATAAAAASPPSPTLSSLCGFLNPDNFVGGRLRLHPERAVGGAPPAGRGPRPRRRTPPPKRWSRSRPRTCTRRSRTCWRATASTPATSPWSPSAEPAPSRRASWPRSSISRACRAAVARHAVRPGGDDRRRQERLRQDAPPAAVGDHRASSSPPSAPSCPRARGAGSPRRRPRWSRRARSPYSADLRYVGQAFQVEVAIDAGLARGRDHRPAAGGIPRPCTIGSTLTPTARPTSS